MERHQHSIITIKRGIKFCVVSISICSTWKIAQSKKISQCLAMATISFQSLVQLRRVSLTTLKGVNKISQKLLCSIEFKNFPPLNIFNSLMGQQNARVSFQVCLFLLCFFASFFFVMKAKVVVGDKLSKKLRFQKILKIFSEKMSLMILLKLYIKKRHWKCAKKLY